MRRHSLAFALLAIAVALVGAAPATAQTPAPRPAPAEGYTYKVTFRGVGEDSASAAVAARVRADLSAIRAAQDAYFAEHGTYARFTSLTAFRPASGATVALLVNGTNGTGGWEAVAIHPALPEAEFRATVARPTESKPASR